MNERTVLIHYMQRFTVWFALHLPECVSSTVHRRILMFLMLILVIFHSAGPVSAQYQFAKRLGIGGVIGHSVLVGEMDKYLQGDIMAGLRLKYNYSNILAFEVYVGSHKRFLNKLEVPFMPFVDNLEIQPEDAILSARISPILLNVHYYFSKWDAKPYALVGAGYYNVATEVFLDYSEFLETSDVLMKVSDGMMGINLGLGMETFIMKKFSLNIQAAVNILFYEAPTTGSVLQFPIDHPRFMTFSLGLMYYFN